MAILISGSVAYDSVCSYGGRFDEMLLPDELSHLNLTFLADTLERYFGGCAGNIAWAMKASRGFSQCWGRMEPRTETIWTKPGSIPAS